MAQTSKAASINIRRIDQTTPSRIVPTGKPAGVVGTAIRGPAFVPVTVPSTQDLTAIYGAPRENSFGLLAAQGWLRNASALTYLRVLGTGDGAARTDASDTVLPGRVNLAGWTVGAELPQYPSSGQRGLVSPNAYAYSDGSDNQIPGRVFFLGAFMKDIDDSGFLAGAGYPQDPSDPAVPVIRGVLFTPSGVIAGLKTSATGTKNVTPTSALSDENYGAGPTEPAGAQVGDVDLTNGGIVATLLLSGHVGSDKWPNVLDFSYDPNAQNYFGKIFNTDPLAFEEAGHYLYAYWDIDPAVASVNVTGIVDGVAGEGSDVMPAAFCLRGAAEWNTGDETSVAYENFEDRYAAAHTPWIISNKIGGANVDLFRCVALDDGEAASRAYKIAIQNIVRVEGRATAFDLLIRDFNDTDESPVVLEVFNAVNLDSESDAYIGRKIGDLNVRYNWDAPSGRQRIVIEGEYENRSNFVRVEVSEAVKNNEVPIDAVPVGYRGVPHLNTAGYGETASSATSLLNVADLTLDLTVECDATVIQLASGSTAQIVDVFIDTSIEGEVYEVVIDGSGLATYTVGSGDTTEDVADALATDIASEYSGTVTAAEFETATGRWYVRVTATANDTPFTISAVTTRAGTIAAADMANVVQPPFPLRQNIRQGVGSKAQPNPRLYWGFQTTRVTSPTDPNASKARDASAWAWTQYFPAFATTSIPFLATESGVDNIELGEDSNAVPVVLDVDTFNNNMFTLERVAIVESGTYADPKQWAAAKYVRDGSTGALDTGMRFVNPLVDFSHIPTRRYLKFVVPMQGGFDGLNKFDRYKSIMSDDAVVFEALDSVQGGIGGPTITAWRRGVDILGNKAEVKIKLLTTPGMRAAPVADYALTVAEERFDCFYIMDVQLYDATGEVIERSDPSKVSIAQTAQAFLDRGLNSSFGAAYFPDVIVPSPVNGSGIVAPASIAALEAYAYNDAVAHPWFAPAGYARGALKNVRRLAITLKDENLNFLAQNSINPLVSFQAAGFNAVWGQLTLLQTPSVFDRVNVRRLLIEARDRVEAAANAFFFENATPELIQRFNKEATAVVADIQKKRGVRSYLVKIDTTTTTQADLDNNTIRGVIYIQPIGATEELNIDFVALGSSTPT